MLYPIFYDYIRNSDLNALSSKFYRWSICIENVPVNDSKIYWIYFDKSFEETWNYSAVATLTDVTTIYGWADISLSIGKQKDCMSIVCHSTLSTPITVTIDVIMIANY